MTKDKKNENPQITINGPVEQLTIGNNNDVCNKKRENFREQGMRNNNSHHQESSDDGQARKKENQGQDKPKKREPSGWAKLLITSAVAILVALIPSIFSNDKSTPDPPTPEIQLFNNEEQVVTHSQFEFVECKLTSTPKRSGYKVKPYPYIAILKSDEWIYIPVRGLYTQDQYSADNDGVCILKRENILTDLQDILKEINQARGQEYEVGCLLLIKYTSDNNAEQPVKPYGLTTGNLPSFNIEKAEKIVDAFNNDAQIGINVLVWPSNKEQIVEVLNDI